LLIQVIKRGGVQAVIDTREFKTVARCLKLPRSCTSAAYVLRVSYEKLLYYYEQKLVFDRNPEDAPAVVQLTVKHEQVGSTKTGKDPVFSTGRPRGRPPSYVSLESIIPGRVARELEEARAARAAQAIEAAGTTTDLQDAKELPMDESPRVEAFLDSNLPPRPEVKISWEDARIRSHLALALQSGVRDQVSWALGLLNAMSHDARRDLQIVHFPGVLDGLALLLEEYLEDVEGLRLVGWTEEEEREASLVPRVSVLTAVELLTDGSRTSSKKRRLPSLMEYGELFNTEDLLARERKNRATATSCALRNISFSERNSSAIAENVFLFVVMSRTIRDDRVPYEIRQNLIDVWFNLSPGLCAGESSGAIVLDSVLELLDPLNGDFTFRRGSVEILARLAANPEKNEEAITNRFDFILPLVIDMLFGTDSKDSSVAISLLCNLSAFDWPARGKLALAPRALSGLIELLSDQDLSSRAALSLLNLAEAPQNRNILLQYELIMVEKALIPSPAAETLASVLSELNVDY